MMKTFAMAGPISNDLLTFGGKVLVHDNSHEMAWLVPKVRIVEIDPNKYPTMRLKDHPDLAAIRWPLNKEDFR